MAFDPGHMAWVGWAPEAGSITESTNGTTPAALPAVPSSFSIVGYLPLPEQRLGLNNSRGRTIGIPTTAYKKRGTVTPSLSISLMAGSLDLLENINRVSGRLPWMCFWVGVVGRWTDVYRFCKFEQLQISSRESTAEASEIQAQLDVQATAYQRLASPLSPDTSLVKALGDPLYYHDARVASLLTPNASTVNLRTSLMSFSYTIRHNLERKVPRPNWGDNQPLSRTSTDMLEHLLDISGELGLHNRLPSSLVNASFNALDWGDLTIGISDVTGDKVINATLYDCFPSELTSQGVEASAQLTHSATFTADDYVFSTTPT